LKVAINAEFNLDTRSDYELGLLLTVSSVFDHIFAFLERLYEWVIKKGGPVTQERVNEVHSFRGIEFPGCKVTDLSFTVSEDFERFFLAPILGWWQNDTKLIRHEIRSSVEDFIRSLGLDPDERTGLMKPLPKRGRKKFTIKLTVPLNRFPHIFKEEILKRLLGSKLRKQQEGQREGDSVRVTFNADLVVKNYGDILGAKLLLEDTLNSLYNVLSDLLNRIEKGEEISWSELLEGYEWSSKRFGSSVRQSLEVGFLPKILTVGGYEPDPLKHFKFLTRTKYERVDSSEPFDPKRNPLRPFEGEIKGPEGGSYREYALEKIKQEIRTFLSQFEEIKEGVLKAFNDDLSSFLERHGYTKHLKFGPVSPKILKKPTFEPSYKFQLRFGEVPLTQFGKLLIEELSPPSDEGEEETLWIEPEEEDYV